jgi:hypothetical protein
MRCNLASLFFGDLKMPAIINKKAFSEDRFPEIFPDDKMAEHIRLLQKLATKHGHNEVEISPLIENGRNGFRVCSDNVLQYVRMLRDTYGDQPILDGHGVGYTRRFSENNEERDYWVAAATKFLKERDINFECQMGGGFCTFIFKQRSDLVSYVEGVVQDLFVQPANTSVRPEERVTSLGVRQSQLVDLWDMPAASPRLQ